MLKTSVFKNYKEKTLNELIEEESKIRQELLKCPEDEKLLKKLGENLYYRKDIQGATAIYEKLVSISSSSENNSILGFLYYEGEKFEESIEKLEIALDKDPKDAFGQFILGNVYSRLGQLKEALFHYEIALFLDFDIYQAHLDFARKYEDMGRLGKALKEYKAGYAIDSSSESVKIKITELTEKLKG